MGIYVGVDPGKEGFSSWISDRGVYLGSEPQPLIGDKGDNFDLQSMVRLGLEWKEQGVILAVLEELSPMGGKIATPQTSFYQGAVYLAWKMLFTALEIPFRTITKNNLKKNLGIKTPAKIPRKPEPVLGDTKPRKPGKKASVERRAEYQRELEEFEKAKSKWEKEHKAWKTADRARLTKWKKSVKDEAVKVCGQLYPKVDLRRNSKCRTPDDNKAESLLYATLALKIDPRRSA